MKKFILLLMIGTFYACGTTSGLSELVTVSDQKIGIATQNPDERLTVNGGIHAQEVRIDLQGALAPDYVFQDYSGQSTANNYKLMPLEELAAYIKKNYHLPNIPSQSELDEYGLDLKSFSLSLLEKIEELTIHLIEQQKQIELLKQRLEKTHN